MGKISNAIQMLNYLNTGNKYTVKELSQKLGITERMVRYYKQELEESGIPIETFMGPNGGYFIINKQNQYNQFNKYDIQILESIYEILKDNDYLYIDKYKKLLDKIKTTNDINEEKSKYFFTNKIEDNSKVYFILNEAIVNNSKITILYRNLNQEWQERNIHPIQIFKFDNRFYVTAYCELRNDIRHFEFNRIKIKEK
ncbi:MAG TPA: WYL domain-containing protein [Candidatus Faecisoma merdavium]|nr:WYL domain-containing protein [Candidatus Faecisoma merdavium]